MFAERDRHCPEQLIGIGGKSNSIADLEQKEGIGLRLFAFGDFPHRNIDTEQVAAVVLYWIIAAEPVLALIGTRRIGAAHFDVDDRSTGFNHLTVVGFDFVRYFGHGFAHRFAKIESGWMSVHIGEGVIDRYITKLAVHEA